MNGVSWIRRKIGIMSQYVVECGENSAMAEIKRLGEGGDYFAFNRPYDSSGDKLFGISIVRSYF